MLRGNRFFPVDLHAGEGDPELSTSPTGDPAHPFAAHPLYSRQTLSLGYAESVESVQNSTYSEYPSELYQCQEDLAMPRIPAAPRYISQGLVERELVNRPMSHAFHAAAENPHLPTSSAYPSRVDRSWASRHGMYERLPQTSEIYSTAMQSIPGPSERDIDCLATSMAVPETEFIRYRESRLRTEDANLFTRAHSFSSGIDSSVDSCPDSNSEYADPYSVSRTASDIPMSMNTSWSGISPSDDDHDLSNSSFLAAPLYKQSGGPLPGQTPDASGLVSALGSSLFSNHDDERTVGVTVGSISTLSDQGIVKKKKRKSKMHQCEICSKQFPRPSGLKTHMNTHNNLKPFSCSFPGCTRTFTVRSNAKRHLRIHGVNPEEFMAESTGLRSGDADYVVNFSEPVVQPNKHDLVTSILPELKWIPSSLSSRSNAGSLKPVSDEGEATSEEMDDDPAIQQATLALTLPLQPVTPSDPPMDILDGQYEERNSYAEAGQYPYHSSQVLSDPCYCSIANNSSQEFVSRVNFPFGGMH